MRNVAIMGNGPLTELPDLLQYHDQIDIWIGADRGALTIIESGLPLTYAVGDFDSVSEIEKQTIQDKAEFFKQHPIEKDMTDFGLALEQAFELNPDTIYFFGVTGGRLDHTLINIQLLQHVIERNIRGILINRTNELEMTKPGNHTVTQDEQYDTISFIPITPKVTGLTLTNFYYPLTNATVTIGSTLSISNKLISNYGTFSYEEGIVLVVKSRD